MDFSPGTRGRQDDRGRTLPAGNEWVVLPAVDEATGAVPGATLLHDRAGGLIELIGAPLLQATALLDGEPVPTSAWTSHLEAGLLPTFTALVRGLELTLEVCCPPDRRGWIYRLRCAALGVGADEGHGVDGREPSSDDRRAVLVDLIVEGGLATASLHALSTRDLGGTGRCRWDPSTATVAWEVGDALPVAALAIRADDGGAPMLGGDAPGGRDRPAACWRHRRQALLAPGETTELTVACGVGREINGAMLAAANLTQRSPQGLVDATRAWLEARHGPPLPDRPALQALRDRNRLFSLVFSSGRTIDTEELVLVASRSPRYHRSGAHWTRDALLWSFPALLAVDPETAAAWLRAAFGRYARRPGSHALYLDGGLLSPGFGLDGACAFHLALDRYLEVARDDTLLSEEVVRVGLERVDRAIDGAQDDATGLYGTALLPSDVPVPLPFVTYGNALTVAALRARARTRARRGDVPGARASRRAADALWITLLSHVEVDGPAGPMLGGATDGEGDVSLGDEPPGSLELLVHYGLVTADDPVWRNTIAWIHSADNPHGPGAGPYATPTSDPAGHASVLSVGNALLQGDDRWLDDLPSLPLDAGFACETFDARSGEALSGPGFAGGAGWIAHAIDIATDDPGRRLVQRSRTLVHR